MKLLLAVRRRWKQYWCKHDWRPAQYFGKPARLCDDCRLIEQLTAAEMYAQFRIYPKGTQ